MKKKEIVCGPDNVNEFRNELKKEPLLYALVKTLYEKQMIDGLRGIKLERIDKEGENGKTAQNAKKTA
jgi:hypothetical protein